MKNLLILSIVLFFASNEILKAQWNAQFDSLPPNIYADTLFSPFYYGVASGDPVQDGVIIWTKVYTEEAENLEISWEVAEEEEMSNIVQSGIFTTDSTRDFTVKIDVSGLSPNKTYYYQFTDPEGNISQKGRTKTAPAEMVDELKFAIGSCSSVYSGFFNAYKRISERDDLDAVIHLGDYVYDFPDTDELVRIPEPFPIDPSVLNEWRDLHSYYLLDPDLRAARQMHPFIVIWDNHDTDSNNGESKDDAIQAFYEYLPVRQVNDTKAKIYRHLAYGDLVDIFMLDAESFHAIDSLETGDPSMLGLEQYNWLEDGLLNSTAKWRVIGSQKLFSLYSIEDSPIDLPIGDGFVVDPGSWDGFQQERNKLLSVLYDNEINNNIVLSGDMHFSMATDIAAFPLDTNYYDPETRAGSIGVEFMASSITRGNLDEMGYEEALADFLINLSMDINPHQRYLELINHGYGILNIHPNYCSAEIWFSDKYQVTDEEEMDVRLYVAEDRNHWEMELDSSVIVPIDTTEMNDTVDSSLDPELQYFNISEAYPNPGLNKINFILNLEKSEEINISFIEIGTGKIIKREKQMIQSGLNQKLQLNTEDIPSGNYLIKIEGKSFKENRKWLKQL